jgi:hypothetical protein
MANKLPYKPTRARYDNGGMVRWLVYQSPQPLRNGRRQMRTRVKRLYFPGDASGIELGKPGMMKKRTGREAYGVTVHYRHELPATTARRGGKTVQVPKRTSTRDQVVELPQGATGPKLTTKPPEGPKMAVA